jgi:hypothetical protein
VTLKPYFCNPVLWELDFDLFYMFEIETSRVRAMLPPYIHPYEIRPSVTLVVIGIEYFKVGALDKLPPFAEVNWVVMVQPDLTLEMEMPKFSFFVGNIGATNDEFLDYAFYEDKLPVYRSKTISINIQRDLGIIEVGDEYGTFIKLKTTFPQKNNTYHFSSFSGQSYSLYEEEVMLKLWSWSGELIEHQTTNDLCEINQHPFFNGIDVSGCAKSCYYQMSTRPVADIDLVFYESIPYSSCRKTLTTSLR